MNTPAKPRVVLIGDSIRMGYQPIVARMLDDIAEVIGPDANCQTSAKILENLDPWVITHQPAVVHLNCGLHDLKREKEQSAHQVEPDAYTQNLETIFTRIAEQTSARLIWATTTPVHDANHAKREFNRANADVDQYNRAAAQVAEAHGLPINDLNALVHEHGMTTLQRDDGVHYTPAGYEHLARQVAATIRPVLDRPT